MLESIIESSKNLIRRTKKPFTATLAGLTLLAASGGCSWKYCGDFSINEGVTRRFKKNLDIEKNVFIYEIKDIRRLENEIQTEITETKNTYQYIKTFAELTEREYKVYYNPTAKLILLGTVGTIILIGPIISIIEGIVHEKREEGIYKDDRYKFLSAMKGNFPELTRWYDLIKLKSIKGNSYNFEDGESTDEILKETIKQKASEIKVRINPEYMFKNPFTKTNQEGVADFLFDETKFPYNQAFSKESLEKKLESSTLVNDIKDKYRTDLINDILKRVEETQKTAIIRTDEGYTTEINYVRNDSKTTEIKIYEIPEEKIYLVLEDFINQEINSKIKEARIRLIDESTHTPIQDAKLDIETEAPTKIEVAKQYFEDDLLKWSVTKIKNYLTGQETIKYDSNGEAIFSVYILSAYKTESTHHKYAFAKFNFDFSDPKKLKQTVEMSQDPQKIRLVDK